MIKNCQFLFFVALSLLFLCSMPVQAAVYTCGSEGVDNSCTPSGLTSLINSASEGDIIEIASGTHSWTTGVTLTKNLTITGGGNCPDCGIQDPSNTWSWPTQLNIGNNYAFRIDSSDSSGLARISGLYIYGHGPSQSYGAGADAGTIVVRTYNRAPYRIDNIRFNHTGTGTFVSIRTNQQGVYGVCDHIYMYSQLYGTTTKFYELTGYGGDNGDTDWYVGPEWGTVYSNVVEDTTVIFENAVAGNPAICLGGQAGGRLTLRNSYLANCQSGGHGTESGWPQRSHVQYDIYNNTFYWENSGDKLHTAFNWRGGSLYFHENLVQNFQAMVKATIYRLNYDYGCGYCDTDLAACSEYDGQWGGSYPPGYPCIDQQGMGKAAGIGLTNTQPQQREVSYIWNNTELNNNESVNNNAGQYLVEGRDYQFSTDNSARPSGYTPFTYPHPYMEPDDSVPNPPKQMMFY